MQNNIYNLDDFTQNDNLFAQKITRFQNKDFGTFVDDEHYLVTLKLLLAHTDETINRINFFKKHILPFVKTDHLLDVGIGDGLLAKTFGNQFDKITLIDPSIKALKCVQLDEFPTQPLLTKIREPIQNVTLQKETIDLALLSHCLYYIDEGTWLDVVKNVFRSLKPNGLMVIVLNGGLDKTRLAKEFNGTAINFEKLAADCSNYLNANYINFIYNPEAFTAKSLDTMLHIVGLHLFDIKARASKEQLQMFLGVNLKNATYKFNNYQKFMVIKK